MHKLLNRSMILATYGSVQGDEGTLSGNNKTIKRTRRVVPDPYSIINYRSRTSKEWILISPNIIEAWRHSVSRKSVLWSGA